MPNTQTETGLKLKWGTDRQMSPSFQFANATAVRCVVSQIGQIWWWRVYVHGGANQLPENICASLLDAQLAAEQAARDLIKAAATELGLECK